MPSLPGGFMVPPLSQVCVWDLLLNLKEDSKSGAFVKQREPEVIYLKFSLHNRQFDESF